MDFTRQSSLRYEQVSNVLKSLIGRKGIAEYENMIEAMMSPSKATSAVIQVNESPFDDLSSVDGRYNLRGDARDGFAPNVGLDESYNPWSFSTNRTRRLSSILGAREFASFELGRTDEVIYLYVGVGNRNAIPIMKENLREVSNSLVHRHDITNIRAAHYKRLRLIKEAELEFDQILDSVTSMMSSQFRSGGWSAYSKSVGTGIAGVSVGRIYEIALDSPNLKKAQAISASLALIVQSITMDRIVTMTEGFSASLGIIEHQ